MSDFDRTYERCLIRHALKTPINVYDINKADYIGQLVNIHQEGLMIMGGAVIKEDHLYQVQLHLPEMINGRMIVQLGIDCLWSRSPNIGTHYWSGCQIIDMSDEAFADVLKLIETMTDA